MLRKMRMSSVLIHPKCAEIDAALARGEKLRLIAETYRITMCAASRRRLMLQRKYPEYLAAMARLNT